MSIVFKAPARLEAGDVRHMRPEFDRLATATEDVVIDFARCEALDGSGVGALVYAFKRLVAGGNRLVIRNVSGQPLNLLNDSGLLRTLSSERSESYLSIAVRQMRQRRHATTTAETSLGATALNQTIEASRTQGAA